MSQKLKMLVLVGIGATFVGCAHGLMRGSVVMKVSDNEAHVCMGDKEVKAGDHVELYENVCKKTGGREGYSTCEKRAKGHGEVTRTLNEHYSVVKFPEGTKFGEGDTIEKHAH